MEDVSSVVSALKVRHSSSLFSEQVPVLGLCLPPSLSSVSPFRFLSLTDAQVYTHTHVHTHTRAHTPQTHRVSSVLQLPGLSDLLAPGFSVFNPTKCLKPSSPLDREPLTDRSASVASSRSPAQCLTHQGHSECKSSSRWFAFLWDGLFLRRVGKVLWRLQDTQDHRRGPRSTCCSRQLLRGPDSCPPLPLHLGIRDEHKDPPFREEEKPIQALPTANHCYLGEGGTDLPPWSLEPGSLSATGSCHPLHAHLERAKSGSPLSSRVKEIFLARASPSGSRSRAQWYSRDRSSFSSMWSRRACT